MAHRTLTTQNEKQKKDPFDTSARFESRANIYRKTARTSMEQERL